MNDKVPARHDPKQPFPEEMRDIEYGVIQDDRGSGISSLDRASSLGVAQKYPFCVGIKSTISLDVPQKGSFHIGATRGTFTGKNVPVAHIDSATFGLVFATNPDAAVSS